ncbi:hypothetical protein GCM10010218_37990 [Streptomyces mashuensis]|uniref:Uncharacterized protein n=1 Tax=Streptomyces mashuensis TaxID=33904 RepID=A0A919ECW9_9ACTN|nr:hypothetical protein [Streptomyces mashuensis]GHF52933.1 hypothetical protein GCM10010218_37990 [Streptomyces mashuensis]
MTKPPEGTDAPGAAGTGPVLHLADTPGYPLARTVAMPEHLPYGTGALSIRFGSLEVRAEGAPEEVSREPAGDGTRVTYRIPALLLSGRYVLEARPDELPTWDTAGNLAPLPESARTPTISRAARLASELEPLPEGTVKQWTDRAREHQDQLALTKNGELAVRAFRTHNEAFHDVFTKSSFGQKWPGEGREYGFTRKMAEHTYSRVDPQASHGNQLPVNDLTWTSGAPYNTHSFKTFTTLQTVLGQMAFVSRQRGYAQEADKYEAASAAAEHFAEEVTKTGNTKEHTVPYTQKAVYSAIESYTPPRKKQDYTAELARYRRYTPLLGTTPGGLPLGEEHGAALDHESTEPLPDEASYRVPMDREDYEIVRETTRDFYRHLAERAGAEADVLYEGACHARLAGVGVSIDLARAVGAGTQAADRLLRTGSRDAEVTLPALRLSVAGLEGWEDQAGRIARERLDGMVFVPELLRESVAETVRYAALAGIDGFALPARGRG